MFINSVFKRGKNYYLQVFWEECKHVIKEKKVPKYIISDIEISDSDRENSNKENSVEENSDEKKYLQIDVLIYK